MNPHLKGWRSKNRCKKKLELEGYLVDNVEKGGKFLKQKDCFGLFDLVAVRKGLTMFVQVTTNQCHPHKYFVRFMKEYGGSYLLCSQYVWIDFKGWIVYDYWDTGTYNKKELFERRKKNGKTK